MRPFDDLTPRGRTRRLRLVAHAALQEYDIEVTGLRLITAETNAVFRVDAGGGDRYVLRVGLAGPIAHSTQQVGAEVEWLAALDADTDLTLPVPISNREGALLTRATAPGVPEVRNCVLFTWLPGRELDENLTPEQAERYGRLAAVLHEHAAGFRPTLGPDARYERPLPFGVDERLFDPELDHDQLTGERRTLFARAATRVEEAISRLKVAEPVRVLHGDLHPWNVMTYYNRLAPIDFEDLMWGWPSQDIATTLYYLHLHPNYANQYPAFRRGYERIRDWPEREAGEIETFMAGRSLVLANDLLLDPKPEWRDEVAPFFARAERRLRLLLDGR
jgi:Ser/Thr protein kinase RdoA (MazF antagonist)